MFSMSSGMTEFVLADGGVVTLKPATPEDYDELVRIYASTRADELAQVTWWDDAQKLAFCRQQYDAQKSEYDERLPGSQYDLILLDGRAAGRFWLSRDGEEMRLLDLALLPWAQGRGVGTALVRSVIDEGRAAGRRIRHTVFVLNEGARRLYERLGFVVFETVAGGAYLHMEWREGSDDS
jgi:ribosomal protein S18 acetylase RimI-like enzyme